MFDTLSNLNWEVILQLVSVGLIVIAGPVVIFVLAFRNGNL
ncbi:photosystem II reaction center protein Ycf12/Psb30 [Nodularia sphaerocarpa]|nr:photosystem II reaction center protein Ycf12 [Nodularia sphaerocarpa]MDB9373442.1 photosystem II reaction center protein Ycf12 [Nodularia sphaerocarpa CS-585]MDB9379771.1 photosystem II reaction center protein Ycf12 [Nodularia sphaerocarpa CS-585A2]ULP74052.1 Photosystem II reaction center protein Ycf12 [Nodularia sphaerocarpa UHCC 0038]